MKKQIIIDYEVEGNRIKDIACTGEMQELTAALFWGGQDLIDCAVNATLMFVQSSPNREAFFSRFFGELANRDAMAAQAYAAQKTSKGSKS